MHYKKSLLRHFSINPVIWDIARADVVRKMVIWERWGLNKPALGGS